MRFDIEKGFPLKSISLKDVVKFIGGVLVGEDKPVEYLVRLNAEEKRKSNLMTYITSKDYWNIFLNSNKESAIINEGIVDINNIPEGKSVILLNQADTAFFQLHELLAEKGIYSKLSASVGEHNKIHPSAVIYDHVIIGNNVQIDANVVIYPNTIIDDDTTIKAGTVIGGQGSEYKIINGRKKRSTHTGGTYIGKYSEIGSLNAIDSHLSGGFTVLNDGVKTDNLVHIAHNVYVDENTILSSCVDLSGSNIIGKDVWIGPNTCTSHEIIVGDYAFISLGSVLIQNVPAYANMVGNPTRQFGWICECHRSKLSFENQRATCKYCGKEYINADGIISRL